MPTALRTATSVALLCLGLAGTAAAQDAAELERRRDAKFQEEWFTALPWTADYDEARAQAREDGKPIFSFFTSSDYT